MDIYNKEFGLFLPGSSRLLLLGFILHLIFSARVEWYGYAFATPIIGIVFFTVSVLIWNQGVKKYRGAGN